MLSLIIQPGLWQRSSLVVGRIFKSNGRMRRYLNITNPNKWHYTMLHKADVCITSDNKPHPAPLLRPFWHHSHIVSACTLCTPRLWARQHLTVHLTAKTEPQWRRGLIRRAVCWVYERKEMCTDCEIKASIHWWTYGLKRRPKPITNLKKRVTNNSLNATESKS